MNIVIDFGRGEEVYNKDYAYRGEQEESLSMFNLLSSYYKNVFLTGVSITDNTIKTINMKEVNKTTTDVFITTDPNSFIEKDKNKIIQILVSWGIPSLKQCKQYDHIVFKNNNINSNLVYASYSFIPYYLEINNTNYENKEEYILTTATAKSINTDDTRLRDIIEAYVNSKINIKLKVLIRAIEDKSIYDFYKTIPQIEVIDSVSKTEFEYLLKCSKLLVWGRNDISVTIPKSILYNTPIFLCPYNKSLDDLIYTKQIKNYLNISIVDMIKWFKDFECGNNIVSVDIAKKNLTNLCCKENVLNKWIDLFMDLRRIKYV